MRDTNSQKATSNKKLYMLLHEALEVKTEAIMVEMVLYMMEKYLITNQETIPFTRNNSVISNHDLILHKTLTKCQVICYF